jgi:hypothetical protein
MQNALRQWCRQHFGVVTGELNDLRGASGDKIKNCGLSC